jgi:hypothetical protein
METLFGTQSRKDQTPGRHAEGTYEFLERSGRPNSAAVRQLLEAWFKAYPLGHQPELRARFIADFHAAFFELLLHAFFIAHGFKAVPHPDIPNTDKHPDFLITKGACRCYLEGTIARDLSDKDAARSAVRAVLLDAINGVTSPNFFLALREFSIVPGKQPAARRLKAFLEKELPLINPDAADVADYRSFEDLPALAYTDETVTVQIGLIPKSLETRGRTGIRPIGTYPVQVRWGGSENLIRDAVNGKATRYGELGLPYVVAVNCISAWGIEDDDIVKALFGTEGFEFMLRPGTPVTSCNHYGAFIGPSGPWNRRVSAVIVGTLYPWSMSRARFELYHNLWGRKSLEDCAITIRQATVTETGLAWSGATNLIELFDLQPGWPDEPSDSATP